MAWLSGNPDIRKANSFRLIRGAVARVPRRRRHRRRIARPRREHIRELAPRDDVPPNTVVEVIEKGFKMKDKIVKHDKVLVSKKPD